METKPATKTAAPAAKKPEPKGEAKPAAQGAGAPPAKGAGGGMGAAPAAGGMPGTAGAGGMPDPMGGLRAMLMQTLDGVDEQFKMLRQKLGGGKIGVELDSGDIVIPAAMVGKIPPALRQQFETCVGCSSNDLMASKRGQSMQGQQKVSKGPSGAGGGMKSTGGAPKPSGDKPSATKSASTSSASRA
jgi:hypothetical protein